MNNHIIEFDALNESILIIYLSNNPNPNNYMQIKINIGMYIIRGFEIAYE